jgi:dynein heavy chain
VVSKVPFVFDYQRREFCIKFGTSFKGTTDLFLLSLVVLCHITPLVLQLTIINFLLSRAGLEDKFLSLFLSNERPELEDQKQMLMVQSASNQRQIR